MKKSFFQGGLLSLAAAVVLVTVPYTMFFAGESPVYAGTTATVSVRTQKQLTRALKSKRVRTIKVTPGSRSLVIPQSVRSKAKLQVNAKNLQLKVRGRTGKLTVSRAKSVDVSGATPSVRVQSENTGLILRRKAKVKNVSISGSAVRLLSSTNADIRSTGKHTSIQLLRGAEKTDVDLQGSGTASSVMNNTGSNVDLDVDNSDNILHAGSVYSGTDRNAGKQDSPLPNDNPLRNYQGMVNDGSLSLEIHGCGQFSGLSNSSRIHGWYHNSASGTDFECYYLLSGGKIKTSRIKNSNFERNFKGEAAFDIVSVNDFSMVIKSANNAYGDKDVTYTLPFDADTEQFDASEAVDPTNPMQQFQGRVTSGDLTLEIHGSGRYASLSSGNSIHGWYRNNRTHTAYECRFNRKGAAIRAVHLNNPNYEKKYLGEASFVILDYGEGFLKLKSTSDTYGDKGTVYTFAKHANFGDPVNENNPLISFSGRVDDDNGGDVSLEIHGSGPFASMSYGDSIHGWYHNSATGTAYECRFNVSGDTIETEHVNNPNFEKNYRGNAQFQITEKTDGRITLKSMNNFYGDEGKTYTFTAGDEQNTTGAPIDNSNPLYPFTGKTSSGTLDLEIHGSGTFSSLSYGNKVHGWYHNSATGSYFECSYIVDGDSITVKPLKSNQFNRGCLGDATFKIISDNDDALTLQSTSDTYGDNGQTYVFYKPGHEPSKTDVKNNPNENENTNPEQNQPTQNQAAEETAEGTTPNTDTNQQNQKAEATTPNTDTKEQDQTAKPDHTDASETPVNSGE